MRTDHYRITVNKRGIDVVQDSGLATGEPLTIAEYDALIAALSKWRNEYDARPDVERVSAESTSRLPEWGEADKLADPVTYTVYWQSQYGTSSIDFEGLDVVSATMRVESLNAIYSRINHWAIGEDGSIIGRVGAP